MRLRTIAVVFALICGTGYAQGLNPQKDLAFPQIAAGGNFETVLTVTNRGVTAYSGTLELYTGNGVPWNPIVNGVTLTNGRLDINLNPGETKTYRITLAGGVQSAFGVIRSANLEQTSFIEGNLTYFVATPDTQVLFESVGMPPSTEFYKTTIPFEDYPSIAFALANPDAAASSIVKLSLFSDTNQQLGSKSFQLPPHGHFAGYVYEQFPGVTLGRGRVEVEVDLPVCGAALTFVPSSFTPPGSLFSSLAMPASPYSYTFTASVAGIPLEGEISIWIEGRLAKGYVRVTKAYGSSVTPETYPLSGQLGDGILSLVGFAKSSVLPVGDLALLIQIPNFSFALTNSVGAVLAGNIGSGAGGTGQVNLTKIF